MYRRDNDAVYQMSFIHLKFNLNQLKTRNEICWSVSYMSINAKLFIQQGNYHNIDNWVLSTGLIMLIRHRKEIRKLTFRALALRRSDSLWRRAKARNVSFRISLRWLIHITKNWVIVFNNYSPKAKWILVNIPRDEVEGNIHQYSRAWGE